MEGRSDLLNEMDQYKEHLNATGCPLTTSDRDPQEDHWGNNQQKIDSGLLGKQVEEEGFLGMGWEYWTRG